MSEQNVLFILDYRVKSAPKFVAACMIKVSEHNFYENDGLQRKYCNWFQFCNWSVNWGYPLLYGCTACCEEYSNLLLKTESNLLIACT